MEFNNDYCSKLKKIKPLSKEENEKLFNQLHSGDESARIQIIEGNLLTVYKIAVSIHNDNQDIPIEDLIQCANLSLLEKCIGKYDPSKGASFSTYLWNTIVYDLWDECRKIRYVIQYPQDYKKEKTVLSIDEGQDFEGETTLGDLLVAHDKTPIDYVLEQETADEFEKCFDVLDELEKQVITDLYQNENKKGLTYKELSKKMNLSQQQVKKIELVALKKLREKYE